MFATSYADDETLQEASKYTPLGYIVKPIERQTLRATLHMAFAKIKQHKTIVIKDGHNTYKIPETAILYLKSENIYTEIHTTEKRITIRQSMQLLLQQISIHFVQTHKSYFVNPFHINTVGAYVLLKNNSEIPISRTYKKAVMESLTH